MFFRTYYYLFKWCYRDHASQSQRNISLSQEIYTCLSPKRNPTSFPNFFRFVQIISPPEKNGTRVSTSMFVGPTPRCYAMKSRIVNEELVPPMRDDLGMMVQKSGVHQLRLSFSFSVRGGPGFWCYFFGEVRWYHVLLCFMMLIHREYLHEMHAFLKCLHFRRYQKPKTRHIHTLIVVGGNICEYPSVLFW